MITQPSADFLTRCLGRVPADGALENYPFPESELEAIAASAGMTEDDSERTWKRFFNRETRNGATEYLLDDSQIAQEWKEAIESNSSFDSVSGPFPNPDDKDYDADWRVDVVSEGRGEVQLYLYLDVDNLRSDSSDLVEGSVLFWLIEPAEGDDREHVYPWYNVVDRAFWDDLRDVLIRHQRRPFKNVCELSTPAATENKEGVEDSIRYFIDTYAQGVEENPETVRNIQKSDDEAQLDKVDFGGRIDESTHILVCECDAPAANSLHLHLVKDGDLVPVGESDAAELVQKKSRSKVREYNDLRADRDNSGYLLRFISVIAGAAIFPSLIKVVPDRFVPETTKLSTTYVYIGIGLFILAAIGVLYAIWPIIRLRRFQWESQPGTIVSRARERLSKGIRNISPI